MKILLTVSPGNNGYIESLINAYKGLEHDICCDVSNFFFSNSVPDILHIHWPEGLYKWYKYPSLNRVNMYDVIRERLEWYRENSTVIIHTIHNIGPHDVDDRKLDQDIFRLIIGSADILVHHCRKSIDLLYEKYASSLRDEQNNIICRHGDYLIHYKKIDKYLARTKYNIPDDKIVTLNFGMQRPYKNERFLSHVFNNTKHQLKYLVIAGIFKHPTDGLLKNIYYKVRNKKRKIINYSDRKFIYKSFKIEELPYIMACADIVLLGQHTALNSGFIALAATYSIPIVMPDIGCFRESADGWIYKTYRSGNQKEASKALMSMHTEIEGGDKYDNNEWLAMNSWGNHAEKIIKAVFECRQRSGQTPQIT